MIMGMTIHDRTPEVISSVFASLRFPGNRPEAIAVCFDRSPAASVNAVKAECEAMGVPLRQAYLDDKVIGFRCPSKAWNAVFDLVDEDHLLCISSDCVLAPHSVGFAEAAAKACPRDLVIGKATHCGSSYNSYVEFKSPDPNVTIHVTSRCLTSSLHGNPLGFAWVLPMQAVRKIEGYSLEYMDGICYEDTDFVLRLWQLGCDYLFFDDLLAMHIEHTRPHTEEKEKIARNEKIFVDKHGDMDALNNLTRRTQMLLGPPTCGISVCCHDVSDASRVAKQLALAQRRYGKGEPWVAIPINI